MYPVLFKIGSFPVQTVGVIHASAIAAGAWWFLRDQMGRKTNSKELYDLLVVVVVWAIIGARLFSVLFDGFLPVYIKHPLLAFAVWDGGFTFYGGFLFALAAGVWYMRKHNLDGWRVADKAAPALALGLAIGRLGCLASGDSYGKPTNLPWAIIFTNPHADAPLGVPLHPTQIYSVATNLAIFGTSLLLQDRRKFEGEVFLLFVLFYAATRSFIEIFRNDPRGVYFNGTISTSQIISIIAVAVAGVFFFVRYSDVNARTEAVMTHDTGKSFKLRGAGSRRTRRTRRRKT